MTEHAKSVSVEREIAAPPEKIFDVLADPSQHPVIDGSGTVKHTRGEEPSRLALGTKFGMSMRLGIPYAITNTVVEFDENRLIAWRHFGGHRWRYELEPAGAATNDDNMMRTGGLARHGRAFHAPRALVVPIPITRQRFWLFAYLFGWHQPPPKQSC